MLTFERIKRFYDARLWTDSQVGDAVKVGVITSEQYKLITQTEYTPVV